MEKSKVLIIQHYTGVGGSTLSCFDIAKTLDSERYDVTVALPGGESDAYRLAQKFNIKALNGCPPVISFTYHNASSGLFRTSLKYAFLQKHKSRWKEILRQENPDVVLLNSSVQAPMLYLRKELGKVFICFIRETKRSESLGNYYLREKLNRMDGAAFLTKYDKEDWKISKKVKQTLIPDIVDTGKFGDDNDIRYALKLKQITEPQTFNVLYLGGFSYIKGIHNIVDAFRYLTDKNIRLFILGSDGDKLLHARGLKRLIYRKEIQCVKKTTAMISTINEGGEQIRVCGIQPDPSAWYRLADVVVFPVQKVHQARPIYEAGYYEKPVIVPDFDNFRDNLIDEYNGLIYNRKDNRDLAAKIRNLYENKDLTRRLGENNKRRTEQFHSEESIKENITRFIDNILAKANE